MWYTGRLLGFLGFGTKVEFSDLVCDLRCRGAWTLEEVNHTQSTVEVHEINVSRRYCWPSRLEYLISVLQKR